MRVRSLLLIAACWSSVSLPGHADQSATEARRKLYEQGRAAMRVENWNEAYRSFAALWQEQQTYDVAMNLAQIELYLHKYREAAEHISFGLRHLPPREKLEVARHATQGLAIAKRHLATLKIVVTGPPAEIWLNGTMLGTSPLDSELYVEPGLHTVAARRTGAGSVSRKMKLEAAEEQTIEFELTQNTPPGQATPVREPTPRASSSAVAFEQRRLVPAPPLRRAPVSYSEQRPSVIVPWSVVLAGAVGAGSLGAGIWFLVVASDKEAERQDMLPRLVGRAPCGNGNPNAGECDAISDLAHKAATYRGLAYASFGATVIASLTAYYFWPRGDSPRRDSVPMSPAVAVSPDHIGLGIHGAF